jgi:alkaline phosphatase D
VREPTRRELIAAATATATAAAVPPAWGKRLLSSRARVGPGRFSDGVASGDPGPRGVTLWSRLETERPRSGARLIVARDADLRRVVATTVVPTGRGINGTLKARVGGLKPATQYYYAWVSGTSVSPVGRTRTLPPAGSQAAIRMASSSCQHYAAGFYGAHRHAARQDLDAYVFLGDYVYERGRPDSPYRPRRDPIDASDLATYRAKYQLYRSDPGLRELHRRHPVFHIWDDHEVENNYTDNNPAPSELQRIAGYRAAFEWIPRMVFPRERHRIHRRVALGGLVDLFLLDCRQYRTGDGDGRPRAMLGERQLNWLLGELRSSRATWKVLAQQVVMAQLRETSEDSPRDDWDGYPAERQRLLAAIEAAGIDNVVVLTGDAHVFMANLLASDFPALGDGSGRKPAAVEYVGGSVTSNGLDVDELTVQAESPWNKQYNGRDHGYAAFSFTPEQLTTDFRRTDLYAPRGRTEAFERFVQPAGANNLVRQRLA